ncbi:hypothetical protein BJV82DRAFT_612722 [Fennellomyces sp. T-0311]|nr:hypothetical protein BJV82DRAFT_612722 [Fennellomyces sp. T-0311]
MCRIRQQSTPNRLMRELRYLVWPIFTIKCERLRIKLFGGLHYGSSWSDSHPLGSYACPVSRWRRQTYDNPKNTKYGGGYREEKSNSRSSYSKHVSALTLRIFGTIKRALTKSITTLKRTGYHIYFVFFKVIPVAHWFLYTASNWYREGSEFKGYFMCI